MTRADADPDFDKALLSQQIHKLEEELPPPQRGAPGNQQLFDRLPRSEKTHGAIVRILSDLKLARFPARSPLPSRLKPVRLGPF